MCAAVLPLAFFQARSGRVLASPVVEVASANAVCAEVHCIVGAKEGVQLCEQWGGVIFLQLA